MLKIIISANSDIEFPKELVEYLKERRIEFTFELDLLDQNYIEVEIGNKRIVLESEEDLIKLLNDDKKDDFDNGSFVSSTILADETLV